MLVCYRALNGKGNCFLVVFMFRYEGIIMIDVKDEVGILKNAMNPMYIFLHDTRY